MITLKEAIKIAEEVYHGGKVGSAGDCGDQWMFSFKSPFDEPCLGGLVVFVHKDTGDWEAMSPAEFVDILIDNKITVTRIDLPE